MNSQLKKILMFLIIILLFALSISQAVRLTDMLNTPKDTQKLLPQSLGATTQPSVEKALKAIPEYNEFKYNAEHKTPFRSLEKGHIITSPSGGSKKPSYIRQTLKLKGILFKKKPLAILEDENGRSHICGIGEIVHKQKILKISEKGVMLRDPLGSYEIPAQDE